MQNISKKNLIIAQNLLNNIKKITLSKILECQKNGTSQNFWSEDQNLKNLYIDFLNLNNNFIIRNNYSASDFQYIYNVNFRILKENLNYNY